MANRSLLRFSQTITLQGFFTPHLAIIRRMNVLYHLFEILVSMENAAKSTCLCFCRTLPKCFFDTEDKRTESLIGLGIVHSCNYQLILSQLQGRQDSRFKWNALDNTDLNLVSHLYVSGVSKDDHFVSARFISAIKRSIDLSSLYY